MRWQAVKTRQRTVIVRFACRSYGLNMIITANV
jgi:hypothetical protein